MANSRTTQPVNITQLECGPMPNVMAALPNIGDASAQRCKVCLTPTRRVPCSNGANIGERKTWTQSEFCTGKILLWGNSPQKCIYSVPAQETAKHHAKFGWLLLSDVVVITKPRRKTHWNSLGCPKQPNRPQPLVDHIVRTCGEDIAIAV